MSLEAITWAFKQPIKSSSMKFVLVAMADFANEAGECYPSVETLCFKTGLERKTVLSRIGELIGIGAIADTGHRRGATGQVKVYQINKEFRNWNCSENGTIPEGKSPENGPSQESQKRHTEPSVREPSVNTEREDLTLEPEQTIRKLGSPRKAKFVPPTKEECKAYAFAAGFKQADGEHFWLYWEGKEWNMAWREGKHIIPLRQWKAEFDKWAHGDGLPSQKAFKEQPKQY